MVLHVTEDVSATAYFHHLLAAGPYRPCYDAERGVYNPLKEMILAPSNTYSKNYKGATFGYTRYGRDGTLKMHNGLDLYAEPGTPVYAMFDGVIGENYVTHQPMRVNDEYPKGYLGDRGDAGNRLVIESLIEGVNVSVGYFHLMVGTPVAINPRTGKPFAPGDIVYQGELIAYAGKTGNAFNVDFPHLHIAVLKNGKYVDPALYINGELESTGAGKSKVVSSREIKNIKCEEVLVYE